MKSVALSFFLSLLLVSVSGAVDYKHSKNKDYSNSCQLIENVDIDLDNGSLVLVSRRDDTIIEITDDFGLYINGKKVQLTNQQTELVGDYYTSFMRIIASAKRIGYEGAKIGVAGAVLGLEALTGTIKLLAPDYSSEDLEAEMEEKANQLEARAKKLEAKAEHIEEQVCQFENLHYRLVKEIPEIEQTGAF